MWRACAAPAQIGVGAELRLFSGELVCFGFGLPGWLGKVLALLGKVLVLLLLVDKTTTMMICCWELRPHCEGQTLLLLKNYGRIAKAKTVAGQSDGLLRLTLASLDLPRTPAASCLARSARETLFGQRLTLTTLGHCERPPTRAPLAPLASPLSAGVLGGPTHAENDGSSSDSSQYGKNGSENAQAEASAAAAAIATRACAQLPKICKTSVLTKTNVPNFLRYLAMPPSYNNDVVTFGQRLTLTTLGHCERLPTRAPLAPLARPESVDVHSAQVSSDLAALGCGLLLFSQLCSHLFFSKSKILQRLTLASLGSPKTPAASDLARSAREALVGGRFW
ncbi:hypothetical protein TYRP_022593 [Tyrophagus putrescentiae]|nr:hypothetical protein TYRP_022593 [Tyrophagus putrescentiae]